MWWAVLHVELSAQLLARPVLVLEQVSKHILKPRLVHHLGHDLVHAVVARCGKGRHLMAVR
jgi:hypothetical protein